MSKTKQARARCGCQITLEDINTNTLVVYELYAPTSSRTWNDQPTVKPLEDGFLSIDSPLGNKLYGKVVGDIVQNYRIKSIYKTERAITNADDERCDLFNRLISGEWLYGVFAHYKPIVIQKKLNHVECTSNYYKDSLFVYSISNRYDKVSSDLFDSVIYIYGSKADILSRDWITLEAEILIDGKTLDELKLPKGDCTFSEHEDDFTDSEKILTMMVRIDPETKRFMIKNDTAGLIYYLCTGIDRRLLYLSSVDDDDDDDSDSEY